MHSSSKYLLSTYNLGAILDAGDMAINKTMSFTARSLHPQWIYRQIKDIVVCYTMMKTIKVKWIEREGSYIIEDIEEATFEQSLE